ncbi:hypothetical protein ACFP1L_09895 [Lactiplantibacillus nangangensis]|uniref:Uncharacterized protein n=2 Tax=Lactiplantibacillus TaxID=2767842 RepID=A0ABW1SKJ5_9LACO|nr:MULTISPECIES: hypothetical protein [Lactiplantibacillus]
MTNANNKLGLLEQNLADAGFNQTDSQKILASFNRGDYTCLQQILQCQRQQLLQTLRQTEFQIDCLDFLANKYH